MILLLCGNRRSGKSTVGSYLVDTYGFVEESFARPIKEMVSIAFPEICSEDLYGSSSRRDNEYRQYPFSGVCLKCRHRCRDKDKVYYCRRCKTEYPKYITPRLATQSLGTEWGRTIMPSIWLDRSFKKMMSIPDSNFLITDCRFKDELALGNRFNAVSVRLLRQAPSKPRTWLQRLLGAAESRDAHATEAELRTIPLSEFDHVVDNRNTSLNTLYSEVDKIMHRYGIKRS